MGCQHRPVYFPQLFWGSDLVYEHLFFYLFHTNLVLGGAHFAEDGTSFRGVGMKLSCHYVWVEPLGGSCCWRPQGLMVLSRAEVKEGRAKDGDVKKVCCGRMEEKSHGDERSTGPAGICNNAVIAKFS